MKSVDKKLTLSLNAEVIDQAKEYAKAQNVSLSKLIENYLDALLAGAKEETEITSLVKSLSGVIHAPNEEKDQSYTDFLEQKYR